MSEGPTDAAAAKPLRRFGIALLGGFHASGRVRLGDRLVRVSLIGGIDLDLTEAEFTSPQLTIVKVSLIGGIDLRLPSGPTTPEITIQSYGLLGGVKLRRPNGPAVTPMRTSDPSSGE